jgi:hypothetical protein
MHLAESFNIGEKSPVKNRGLFLRWFHSPGSRQLPEGIHYVSDIYTIRAAGSTGLAGGANPDRIAVDDIFSESKVDGMYHPVG